MKKIILLLFICQASVLFAQPNCNYGLSPGAGIRGQALTTTITNTMVYMGQGTMPCNPNDVFLKHSINGDTIYASTLSIHNDSVRVSWNIPSNARVGNYDLNLNLYQNFQPFPNCSVGPYYCFMPSRFSVGTSLITGMVYYDVNQNGIYDAGDSPLANRKLLLMPDSLYSFTDFSGNYQLACDTGTHTIKIINDAYFISTTPDSIQVNVTNSNVSGQNFGIYPTSTSYNNAVHINGRPRCSTTQTYSLYYENISGFPVNMVIKLYHSPNTSFVSASVTPDSISGDTLYFSVSNFVYGSGHINIDFTIPAIGNTVEFDPIVDLFDLANNQVGTTSDKLTQTVRCSFDPNDKSVNPEGETAMHYTLFGDDLFYTIRFQNTGNDTAYAVRVLDSLDSDIDLNSFRLIDNSHPVVIEMDFNGVINFHFYNIMLPDSNTDEPASHGFVSYVVKAKTGLPENTLINNRSYIYFDQNSPVITNLTENNMVSMIPVGIYNPSHPDNISVFPNPFDGNIQIQIGEGNRDDYKFTVSDAEGRLLISKNVVNGSTIDTHELASGIYLYRITNPDTGQSYYGRLIKK